MTLQTGKNIFMMVTALLVFKLSSHLNPLFVWTQRRNCTHTLILVSIPSTSPHTHPRKGSDNLVGRADQQPEVTVSEGRTRYHFHKLHTPSLFLFVFLLSSPASKLKVFLARSLLQGSLSTFSPVSVCFCSAG